MGRLFRKLDLTFLLLLAVAPTPACVIPVGPEWQDPLGNPDAPPRILNPNPYWGADVFASPSNPQVFVFFVTDANVEQPLRVQGFVDNRRFLDDDVAASSGGTRVPQRIEKTVACADLDRSVDHHNIIVAVTDNDDTVIDVSDNVLRTNNSEELAIITWQLNMTCQSP